MNTCRRGAGHTGKDRDLASHKEDTGDIDIGPNNDNESTNSLDITIAFGGPEADSNLDNLLPNSQADLSILIREINSLLQ